MGDQKPITRADILDAARQAVTQDRAATHGAPENTFGLIARLWSARLGQTVSPAQVTIMLIDLKTSRAWGNIAHMDNWVDIAGYAACGGELAAEYSALNAVADKRWAEVEVRSALMDARMAEVLTPQEREQIGRVRQRPAAVDQTPCFYCGAHPDSVMGLYFDMPICGGCLANAKDAPTAHAMRIKAIDARQPEPFELHIGLDRAEAAANPAPNQSPVAVVDFAEEATAEALAQIAEIEASTPSPEPAPEPEKPSNRFKWTPDKDAALIGGVAAKVANGMSRRAASHATAVELGLGEKACEVRVSRDLGDRVAEAVKAAEAAKKVAADLAKTMAPAKAAPKPAPAAQPLSKRLSTPPHVTLNIDTHLIECRAKGWAFADDLRLFEMVVTEGFGMGDVALDMGRDSKAIKDRYDRLTGMYRDANDKWCRKYGREDVLAALRKAAGVTGGADK